MEDKIFTLKAYIAAIDNAYATGKANATIEEKENLIKHMKESGISWAEIVKKQNEK
jgi:hypothetical protein